MTIPEPHEFADAYYARMDESWERFTRNATCEDCTRYRPVPDRWVVEPCGWCTEAGEFCHADDSVRYNGCESFEPNASYNPGDYEEVGCEW